MKETKNETNQTKKIGTNIKQEKTARYDSRVNHVIVTVKREGPVMDGDKEVGYTSDSHNQLFEPDYIKKVFDKLNTDRVHLEKELKKSETEPELKFPKEELEALRERIIELNKLDQHEKNLAGIEHMKTNLEALKDDIRILSPIMKQLTKAE